MIRIPRPTRIPRRTPHLAGLPAVADAGPLPPPRAQSDRPFYPSRDGPYSIPETAPTGETVWRNADEPTLADTPYAGCHTVYDVFEFAIARNGGRPAMGERAIERSEMVEGFEKLTLSEYKWSTFTQVKQRVGNVASGLADLASLKKGTAWSSTPTPRWSGSSPRKPCSRAAARW